MTTIQVYRDRRNSNKYIEVHNDGHYHNSLKQYLYWERNVITGEPLPEPVEEHHRRQTAPSLEKSEPEGTARRLRASNSIKKGGTHMAAATLEMDNKELKKQTEDIEEMISLLKQLTSGEKREVKGIMIGLQMAKQAGLTA